MNVQTDIRQRRGVIIINWVPVTILVVLPKWPLPEYVCPKWIYQSRVQQYKSELFARLRRQTGSVLRTRERIALSSDFGLSMFSQLFPQL